MIDDLDPSSSILRQLVAEALKDWDDVALLELVKNEDVVVRTAAARELHVRGNIAILNSTLELAENGDPASREIAAFILGQLGTPDMPYKNKSLPLLLSLTRDIYPDVRSAAAAAIGHLCYSGMPKEIESRLIELCKDVDPDVRSCAAFALGNSSGSHEVRKALNELLGQEYVGEYAELGIDILDEKLSKT